MEQLWLRSAVQLGEKDEDALASSTDGRRYSRFDAENVFACKITKAGKFLPGIDDVNVEGTVPMVLRGSGGQQALGMHSGSSPTQSLQPQSLLSQLFRADRKEYKQPSSQTDEGRLASMEQKLDKIEEMLSRLIAGPLSNTTQ